METLLWSAALLLATAGSFLFSGAETGFYAINRVRLTIRVEAGDPGAKRVARLLEEPSLLILVVLVCNNLVNAAASFFSQELLLGVVDPSRIVFWNTLVLSPFLFVFGEITPKDCFRKRAGTWTTAVARVLAPGVLAVSWLRRGLLAPFGVRPGNRGPDEALVTRRRLELSILEGAEEGLLSGHQSVLARNILGLRETPLHRVMVPLTRLSPVPRTATVAEVLAALRETGDDRIPVHGERRDELVGILDLPDLVGRDPDEGIAERVGPLVRLDASMTVIRALQLIRAARQVQAAVVRGDQVVGWVTVKDLVEEIVGELRAW